MLPFSQCFVYRIRDAFSSIQLHTLHFCFIHLSSIGITLTNTRATGPGQCRTNAVIVVGMLITITLRTPMPMGIKPMPKTIRQVQKYRIPYRPHRPRRCLSHHLYRPPRQPPQQLQQVNFCTASPFYAHAKLHTEISCALVGCVL